jgi:hypothetical protein
MKHNHPRKWSTMDLMLYADNELDQQQRKHLRADLRVSRELRARIRPFIDTRVALLALNK